MVKKDIKCVGGCTPQTVLAVWTSSPECPVFLGDEHYGYLCKTCADERRVKVLAWDDRIIAGKCPDTECDAFDTDNSITITAAVPINHYFCATCDHQHDPNPGLLEA